MLHVLTTSEYQEIEKKLIVDEMDVIFKDEGRFMKITFNTSKAIDAANIRFPRVLEIIDDCFAVVISKQSIFPMKLWCNENNLKSFDF